MKGQWCMGEREGGGGYLLQLGADEAGGDVALQPPQRLVGHEPPGQQAAAALRRHILAHPCHRSDCQP